MLFRAAGARRLTTVALQLAAAEVPAAFHGGILIPHNAVRWRHAWNIGY